MRSKNKSKNELVQAILDVYQPETAKDVQDALKDVFGPMFEAMLQGEMNSHLGYENNDKGEKTTNNRRNGYISKNVKTTISFILYKKRTLNFSSYFHNTYLKVL